MPESGADIAPHRGRATAPQGQPRTPTPTCASPDPAQPPQPPRNPVPRSTRLYRAPHEVDARPELLLAGVPERRKPSGRAFLRSSPCSTASARHDEVAVVRLERWLRARGYDDEADRVA